MKTLEYAALGLTLTESDSHLLEYASMLAGFGVFHRLEFVHVAVPVHYSDATFDPDSLQAEMRTTVERFFPNNPAALPWDVHVVRGERIDGLLDFVQKSGVGLMVVGHRRNRSGQRFLSQRLAMISPASVWMIPEGTPCRLTHVLAPVDYSSHSADSLAIATGLSQLAGLTQCTALHVYFDSSVIRYDETVLRIVGQERNTFSQFITPLDLHSVTVEPLFEESNNVARTILRVAAERNCDLIVMSTRGRSRAASILLGSETAQTMMESPIPVLAVKHRGAMMSLYQVLSGGELRQRPMPHTN